jgi:hypothetical protein
MNANVIKFSPRKRTGKTVVAGRVYAFIPRSPTLTERIRNDYNHFPINRANRK